MKREKFSKKGTNTSAIAVTSILAIDFQEQARLNNNLPHNALVLANTSTTCKLFVFLDNANDLTTPDYVIFPSQQMVLQEEEGTTFHTVFVYNTHAVDEVAIGELKYRISTVKEV